MQRVKATVAVNVFDLKSPSAVLQQTKDEHVAALNHNRIMAYMVHAHVYEATIEQLDDLHIAERARAHEHSLRISSTKGSFCCWRTHLSHWKSWIISADAIIKATPLSNSSVTPKLYLNFDDGQHLLLKAGGFERQL